MNGQCLCPVYRGHQGHIHAAQNRLCPQRDSFIESLCTRGFDEAAVDHHAATRVGGEAGQCRAIAHGTGEGDHTRCVEG